MGIQMGRTLAAVLLFAAMLGAGTCRAGDRPTSIDIVVQGTMKAIIQAPSGMRDSSWSGLRRIPSCRVLGMRNTSTGTPIVHIVVSECEPGEYVLEAVSAGRALGFTAMAEGPDWQCGRGDGISAPASGESRSWSITFPDSTESDCPLAVRRLGTKRRNR